MSETDLGIGDPPTLSVVTSTHDTLEQAIEAAESIETEAERALRWRDEAVAKARAALEEPTVKLEEDGIEVEPSRLEQIEKKLEEARDDLEWKVVVSETVALIVDGQEAKVVLDGTMPQEPLVEVPIAAIVHDLALKDAQIKQATHYFSEAKERLKDLMKERDSIVKDLIRRDGEVMQSEFEW